MHHDIGEVMFVLSGEFSFKVGDEFSMGGPGTCVFMPRDIPHAWKNSGSEPGGVFFIYTPGEAGKVFEEQTERRGAIVNGPEAAQLMRRHGWGIVGPPPF